MSLSDNVLLLAADGYDFHTVERTAHFTHRGAADRCLGDLFQNVIAFDQLTEAGVLSIQESRVAGADEELTAGGIRMLGASHGDDSADMVPLVELSLDLIARIARAG